MSSTSSGGGGGCKVAGGTATIEGGAAAKTSGSRGGAGGAGCGCTGAGACAVATIGGSVTKSGTGSGTAEFAGARVERADLLPFVERHPYQTAVDASGVALLEAYHGVRHVRFFERCDLLARKLDLHRCERVV